MKKFLDENFLLETTEAERLYHGFASDMPLIDYHNHLSPHDIANDRKFTNISEIWLEGDHYKWRAMRANGVAELYCTGNASAWEKFEQWAYTVPYTMCNPLYHWTHLELQRYFGIHQILSPETAKDVFDACNEKLLQEDCSVKHLLRNMKVEYMGTTDDPLDDLAAHKKIKESGFEIKVSPSFRPDKAINIEHAATFNSYVNKLALASGEPINDFDSYVKALRQRHDHFSANGCTVSDNGMEQMFDVEYTPAELKNIFSSVRLGDNPTAQEIRKFTIAMLVTLGEWAYEKNWVQQFHMGPIRNNNERMFALLGADTGWDSMGSSINIKAVGKFLSRLDKNNTLSKTILYSINPVDNDALATMVGNFNDGTLAGKIQLGSAWWFNDQKDGMIQQLKSVSNMGLLSRFVGMLTDSRSFLSFPRHEYFRRILCNMLGGQMANGELPNDEAWIGQMVQNICYYNAKKYFNL